MVEGTGDRSSLPRHIAFVMDGNGRWARQRGFLRLRGHEEGAKSLRRLTRHCRSIGVEAVTFYALSTENFERRPAAELGFLFRLLKRYLIDERSELLENDIRLKAIGETDALPADVRAELAETERLTALSRGMVLRLALNYGARQEILRAVKRVARQVSSGEIDAAAVEAMGTDDFRRYLWDAEMSDPDLLIRTAGEYRLSSFLLWQVSYAELWVTDALWPDFDVDGLETALTAYAARERKYGAVGRRSLDSRTGAGKRPANR